MIDERSAHWAALLGPAWVCTSREATLLKGGKALVLAWIWNFCSRTLVWTSLDSSLFSRDLCLWNFGTFDHSLDAFTHIFSFDQSLKKVQPACTWSSSFYYDTLTVGFAPLKPSCHIPHILPTQKTAHCNLKFKKVWPLKRSWFLYFYSARPWLSHASRASKVKHERKGAAKLKVMLYFTEFI